MHFFFFQIINYFINDLGDLNISVSVLFNYLEANNKVPWEDLRYLFGEIMYGGHITDDWDRKLCISYLEELMQSDLVKKIRKIVYLQLLSFNNISFTMSTMNICKLYLI